ncbi:XisI protein [Fibrella sp. HMF5335]|uniref:XisI protein n=1 Tax=Fibrella rubiginis TaxID=2817060 RepID=A0A939K7D1_9BACT|nr:XisI protein [Fibrella rubiginis]MBO0939818.1 XisI protein [Fibrella rubiginis]
MKNKAEKYQKIIQELLEEYAQHRPVNLQDIDNQVTIDSQRGHYQLVRVGWSGDRFVRNTVFHFDLKPDDKIWIQANWTDVDIAATLVERGVERTDIVLGFQPPRYRAFSGYAVA